MIEVPAKALRGPGGLLLLVALVVAGCGGSGGGGGGNGGNVNLAPTAGAGADRTVVELTGVDLNGTGSDPNGDTLTFLWEQTAGTAVQLSDPTSAQTTFIAPSVQAGMPQVLTFQLTVTDPGGLSDSDSVDITVQEPGAAVTISGQVDYEFVPPNANCNGLNYLAIESRPVRAATVQVIDAASDVVLGDDVTDDGGAYAITVDPSIDVYLRVRAELERGGTPSWDVEVRDNSCPDPDDPATCPALSLRPIYALDSGVFDSGQLDQMRNLTATSGWGGSGYTSVRAAAPFAILDAIYTAMELVLSADPQAEFAPLDAFWSVNNTTTDGDGSLADDAARGEIGTSFYSSGIDSLFLLGMADVDTEEFDDHVIVHEWGHYFEDVFSRSDSIGGAHGFGDRLDMRVAFGEGWATALSGMALGELYCDTAGVNQAGGFDIDIESDTPSPRGWYNEFSVMALLYDLWDDATVETGTGDTGSIGFEPIFATMTGPQRTTASHTSIFSFLSHLVTNEPSALAVVTDLRSYHDINGSGIYGDDESNDGTSAEPDDALPVYTDIQPNGTPVNVCSNREHDTANANGNRLSEHRFLRMTIATQSRYEFDIQTDAATVAQLPLDDPDDDTYDREQSDPDMWFYLDGIVQNLVVGGDIQGLGGEANRENFTTPNELEPGDYVMDVVEYRHRDEQTDQSQFPARSCFDLTIQPAP